MWKLLLVSVEFLFVVSMAAAVPLTELKGNKLDETENVLSNTELVMAFAVFRHGDRTPDLEEMALYKRDNIDTSFYPYGPKALTNNGKIRAYNLGLFLRSRYDGFISRLYLPEEINIRATNYDRTKMTVLTASAALFPPVRLQRWNRNLPWQPVPYNVKPYEDDDLLYFYNCPEYMTERSRVYNLPEYLDTVAIYQDVFEILRTETGSNITVTDDVFNLDNLFQAEENVGLITPDWALAVMPEIKELTKLEFAFQFYNSKLIRLSTGVLLQDIFDLTSSAIKGNLTAPKFQVISAHENNVAALMAASGVFEPHQPPYGATFVLELRKDLDSGKYAFAAVYAPQAGLNGPAKLLKIDGCTGGYLCEYNEFLKLTKDLVLSRDNYQEACRSTKV